jgi:hypothetical protein
MANVGSFVVNTYMNNDNFLAGVKSATAGAKKMETGIIDSINKINSKQIKNIGENFLKSVSVVGAIDIGLKMAEEMLKGFKDGSIKGIPGAVAFTVQKLTDAFGELPVYGSIMRLSGAGADAVSGGTMDQENAQLGSRGIFEKKQKEIAELDKRRQAAEAANKELADKNASESAAKQKKLDDEDAKVKKFYENQRVSSEQEILKIKDDLRKASMSERDIEVERIRNLKTIPEYLKEEGIAAYDALVALRTRLDLEKQIQETKTKAHEKAQKEFEDSQQNIADADKDYQSKLEETKKDISMNSSNTDISTALGSIKVAGTGAMNVQKIAEDSLSVQKLQLEELRKTSASLSKQLGAP